MMQQPVRVGHYELIDEIGRGGIGVVYRARDADASNEKTLALKVLPRVDRGSPMSDFQVWRGEFEALSRMDHHNIVRLMDFGETPDCFYLAMEYIEGHSLAELLGRPVPKRTALSIVVQVARALAFAHSRSLIHLDLKPANIMLAGTGSAVKVLDFGLSRLATELADTSDLVSGTLLYMAPEQLWKARAEVGPHSDIYALGVILVELLSGKYPFDASDPGQLVRHKLAGRHIPLRTLIPGIPSALDKIAERMLSADASRRYQSAEGVLHDLELCLSMVDKAEADFDFPIGTEDYKRFSTSHIAFVGRAQQLKGLEQAHSLAKVGAGRTAFVMGGAGIGKSSLVSEFSRKVVAQGGSFLLGKCTSNTRKIPYYPLLAGIADYVARGEKGPEGQSNIENGLRISTIRFLHSALLGVGAEGALDLEGEHSRERFFNLVVNSLVGMARAGQPLVLALDDMQWADSGSLEICRRLSSRIEDLPVLLIISYRAEEVEPESELGRLVLGAPESSLRLLLGPLGEDETRELAASMFGNRVLQLESIARFLTEYGKGHPLTTLALATRLNDEGVVGSASDAGSLAARLQEFVIQGKQTDAVKAVLSTSDSICLEALRWGAVLGDRFNAANVARLLDWPIEKVIVCLDGAIQRGILRNEGAFTYSFSSDELRDYAYRSVSSAELRSCHQKVAELLDQGGGARDNALILDLAEHYSRGTGIEKALEYGLQAGAIACRSHAHDSARRYLKSVLIMTRVSSKSPDQLALVRFRAHDVLGQSFAASGEYLVAQEQFEHALALAPDSFHAGQVMGRQAAVLFMKGELEAASTRMEAALARLAVRLPKAGLPLLLSLVGNTAVLSVRTPSEVEGSAKTGNGTTFELGRVRVAMLAKLAFINFFYNTQRAHAIHLIGLRIAETLPNCIEKIETISHHGPSVCAIPLHNQARRYARRAVELADALQNPQARMLARFYGGACYLFLAQWDEADAHFRECVSLYQESGDIFSLELAHENLGFSYFWRGRFEQALLHFVKALDICIDVGDLRGEAVNCYSISLIHLAQGEVTRAFDSIENALSRLGEIRDYALRSAVLRTGGVVAFALGERDRAEKLLNEAVELVEDHKLLQEYVAPIYCVMVETLLGNWAAFSALSVKQRGKRLSEAARHVNGAFRFARRYPAHRGPALRSAALVALRKGQTAKAHRLFRAAVDVLNRLDMQYELARTYDYWAQAFPAEDPGRLGCAQMARRLYEQTGSGPLWGDAAGDSIEADSRQRRNSGELNGEDPSYQTRQLKNLIEVGKTLAATLDLQVLFERTMDLVLEVTEAEKGLLVMKYEAGEEAVVTVTRAMEEGIAERGGGDVFSHSIIDQVLASGEPLLLSDAMLDRRFASAKSVYRHRLRSVLCFPLTVRKQPRGAIYLENNTASHFFGRHHLELVQVYAAQASIALENSLVHRQIEQLNRELEMKVATRTAQLQEASGELLAKNQELTSTIRELNETRDKMVQQAKMASLGLLAAGANHEISNPLNFMNAGAFALRKKISALEQKLDSIPGGQEERSLIAAMLELTDIISNGCDRIQGIVDGLASLSLRRQKVHEVCDVRDGMGKTLLLVKTSLPTGVALETDLQPVPSIECWPGELNQVFLNLILNAIESIEGQGTVTVGTQADHQYIYVWVKDTGSGIGEENLGRIFEPFFTTKEPGKGTGLGLAICLGIVERHGGTIKVESQVGVGSTFTVCLPLDSGGRVPLPNPLSTGSEG